jgi:hypothetical protein
VDCPTAIYQITGIHLTGDIGEIELTDFHPECEHRNYSRACLSIRAPSRAYGSTAPFWVGWGGSILKLIPSVFEARSRSLDVSEAERRHWSRTKSGSLIGICSAVGALGGVGINLALRESYLRSGTETSAYWMFLASYVVAAILTWMRYVRRPVSAQGVPSSVLEAEPARA